ncbi:bacteriocin [Pseudomonas syringae pv. cunninghamiae]|nr:bacteriocin [Pseudomonas syringae pv. cunninghamiae]
MNRSTEGWNRSKVFFVRPLVNDINQVTQIQWMALCSVTEERDHLGVDPIWLKQATAQLSLCVLIQSREDETFSTLANRA